MAKQERLNTAKAALIRALEISEQLLDGFPIPGAKGTIGAALEIIKEAERMATNTELCDELREHLLRLNDELLRPLVGMTEDDIPKGTRAAVEEYTKCIGHGLQHLSQPKKYKYGLLRRWIRSKEMEGEVRKLMEHIELNTRSYMIGTTLRQELTQHQQGAAIQDVKRHQNEEAQDNRRRERDNALNKLRRAPEARLDSSAQPLDEDGKLLLCFKNTRVTIINKIMNWINDPNSPPIFWLHGLAGTGKSTIARTIGVKAEKAGYTTASFFFSRTGVAGQRDPAYVFPTIAHQLATGDNQLHEIIGDAVIGSPDIDFAAAFKQFQTLIATPLHTSKGTGNILILLDALDECQGIEDKRPQEILACLRDNEYRTTPRMRILLTSRPEYYLRRELASRPQQVIEHNLHQDDESAQGDIALFLKAKLPLIPSELDISVEGWPREEDVQMLSEKSGSLFIFAKTALRFIGDDQVLDPQQQMDILLAMDHTTVNAYSPLDKVYLEVLESALSRDRDDIFIRFRRVVGCIILSQDPLPVSAIAKIVDCSVRQVMATLLRLQSVIQCSLPPGTAERCDSDLLPHVYHPSFPDFLVDSRRCSNHNFTIMKPEMHAFIVRRCFELTKGVLHRNILGLDETYLLNRCIPDLKAKVLRCITPEAAYACQFWLSHLVESTRDESTLGPLHEFLSERFLWWCEALSLLDSACRGQEHLLATAAFKLQTAWEQVTNTSCNPEVVDLLHDTYRFLYSHHRTISESAMNTYYSALPFTPHDTCLYRLYKQDTSHSITVLQGLSPTWTPCLSSLFLGLAGFPVLCVSPDGMRLAVSQDDKILILDARTTASQCHINRFTNFPAFSPSESTLATVMASSPPCLELWNTTTGINQQTQTLSGTDVHAVGFSSQGQFLLLSIDQSLHLHHGTSASELSVLVTEWSHKHIIFTSSDTQVITGSWHGDTWDGHIHFFNLSNNQLSEIRERRIFNEAQVWGLALRRDGERLASGGVDGAIRIYDLRSQSRIATLRRPESMRPIAAIAYHPMEEELAVCQDDCVVLWREKETASDWVASIHSYHTSNYIRMAYCVNGTRLCTNTLGGGLKLWANTMTPVEELPKHADFVSCHAFNHPKSLLATGSGDMTIILWRFTTGGYLRTLLGHTEGIESLIFSDDGVLLASGSRDSTTMVWDVETGGLLHRLRPHYGCSVVVAFSKDNACITTRMGRECFVWELQSGELLEQRDQDMSIDAAPMTLYFLQQDFGWQLVVEWTSYKRKCLLFRPPAEYGEFCDTLIFGDRAALLCYDGRVVILDLSRVMHRFMDPAGELPWNWWQD